MNPPLPPSSARPALPILLLAILFLGPAGLQAGPEVACPDGPDPLRFRPEMAIPGGELSATAFPPLAVSAAVDPVTGREWVALAWVNTSDEVVVAVSADGACSFDAATGGMAPVVVANSSPADEASVAFRAEDGAVLLAFAGGGGILVTDALDGNLDGGGGGSQGRGPVLALTPPPAPAVLGAAEMPSNFTPVELWFTRYPDPLDLTTFTTTWVSGDVAADLGPGAEAALAADAAGFSGAGGFTVLMSNPFGDAAWVRRSNDAGATFEVSRRVDDSALAFTPTGVSLAAGAGPADAAWRGLAWNREDGAVPNPHRVEADAARVDAGALIHEFDGIAGSGNLLQQEPVDDASRTAVAVGGGAPGDVLHMLWTDAGEVQGARRPLAQSRPNLAGGCGPFQVTGISPARPGGIARHPAASALGPDVVLAFQDDRSGTPAIWLKRSDSAPPAPDGLAAAAADCGDPPSVQLDWTPPACDVVRQTVEVGTAPGGTDFTREAGAGASSLLVEGLEPDTTYWFRLVQEDAAGNVGVSDEVSAATPICADALPEAGVIAVTDTCAFGMAGGDGMIDPGEAVTLRVAVENTGTDTAAGAILSALSRSPRLLVLTAPVDLGDIDPGVVVEADIDIEVTLEAACGEALELLLRTDASGAAWSDLEAIPVPPGCTPCDTGSCAVTADGTLSAPLEFCRNQSVNLDGGASGAVDCGGRLLYGWWDGGNRISTSVSTSETPANSRTYRLVVACSTDPGCTDETTVDVTVNQLPGVSFTEDPPPPHCDGDTVTLTASTSDPAATFAWGGGETTPDITVTADGVYPVTVTDTKGCVRGRSHRVDFGAIPPADAGPDPSACEPVVIGTEGFPTLDYWWDPPDGLSARNIARPVADPAVPTLYTLTVTDPLTGCSGTDDVLVEISPLPAPVTSLAVSRSGTNLLYAWDPDPDASASRVYSETDSALARSANGASPTALLVCEGAVTCEAAPGSGNLIYYQAVGLCVDGVLEGPN